LSWGFYLENMPKGYKKDGSFAGRVFQKGHPSYITEESKRKISEANKGRIRSKEAILKTSKANRGKKRSEECKKIMSEQKMGDRNPAKRLEVRQKIREKRKFQIISEETKKKISMANKGKAHLWQKGHWTGGKNPNWKGGIGLLQQLKNKEIMAGRKRPSQCEICGSLGEICFDHNHKTGEFRGWICHRCNLALGLVKDNTELLLTMIDYLKGQLILMRKNGKK
jgi:hypothetical protein